jgi:hypothetical protein
MPSPVYFLPLPLGQVNPWEDAPPAATQPHRLSFSDLKQGLHDYDTGKTNDDGFRNGILSLLAVIALVALFIHFRQRHKTPTPPDSLRKLGRELGRLVRFPLGSRLFLHWVARSTQTPFAALLLSAGLFDKCVAQWSRTPTFAAARRWGNSRLQRLRPVLFEEQSP